MTALTSLRKEELQALADENDVAYEDSDTREDLIAKLRDAGVDQGDDGGSKESGDGGEAPRDPGATIPPDVLPNYVNPRPA